MIFTEDVNIYKLYEKVVIEYEKELKQYSFQRLFFKPNEFVYVIQDSFVVYLGIIDCGNDSFTDNNIVFEELTENSIFKFNFSNFIRKLLPCERLNIKYKRFHGFWGEPIFKREDLEKPLLPNITRPLMVCVKSKADIINKAFPSIQLRKRFEAWPGYLYYAVLYEVKENNHIGYGVYATANPKPYKIARLKAEEIEYQVLECLHFKRNARQEIKYMWSSINHQSKVFVDKTMMEILASRYENKADNRSCLISENSDSSLHYFCVPFYVKNMTPLMINNQTRHIIESVKSGDYQNYERIEYTKTENKWKSEQLVLELVEKTYKKNKVLYQYRPFFLQTDKGQMSYDVFICGLNVAIEYQGKQHFEPVEYFGGEKAFEHQKKRDILKRELSYKNNVKLVYINYWEDISIDLIKTRVQEALKDKNNEYNFLKENPKFI